MHPIWVWVVLFMSFGNPEPQVINKDYKPTPFFIYNLKISALGLSGLSNSLMKKVFFSIMLLFGAFCFSQTITEKYNSIYGRYDYIDSYGNLVAFKKFNIFSKQWEYYRVDQAQQRKPYQYKDPEKLDISGLGNAATTLQGRYNSNQKNAQVVIDDIVSQIKSLDISDTKKEKILNDFTQTVNSNMQTIYNGNVNWLYDAVNTIIKNVTD